MHFITLLCGKGQKCKEMPNILSILGTANREGRERTERQRQIETVYVKGKDFPRHALI